jgi:hypothetical protein
MKYHRSQTVWLLKKSTFSYVCIIYCMWGSLQAAYDEEGEREREREGGGEIERERPHPPILQGEQAGWLCVSTVEASETRGTTALVYCLINSSLYTRTVQGC